MTYCANRFLTYHLYADGSGLLVFGFFPTSGSLLKNTFSAGEKSDFLFHKSVFIAVDIQPAFAAEVQACFGIAFRVELYKLHSI